MNKVCSRCKEEKPVEAFSKLKQAKDGLRHACRECLSKDYYDNLESRRATIRNSTLKYRYGITQEEYEEIFNKQEGRCSICDKTSNRYLTNNLDIDHDHNTGKVRGLLCNNCNRGIGHLQEDVNILRKAIEYLKE